MAAHLVVHDRKRRTRITRSHLHAGLRIAKIPNRQFRMVALLPGPDTDRPLAENGNGLVHRLDSNRIVPGFPQAGTNGNPDQLLVVQNQHLHRIIIVF